jgi:RNA polymerase sigma-70 factor (ECF subfamily)
VSAHPRAPARDTVGDPPPEVLNAYLRSWETRDLESLVALLRKDVVFAMPPHGAWFHGADALAAFLQMPPFSVRWARGLRGTHTRANGLPALVWYSPEADDGVYRLHSIQVMRFQDGALAEATNFIGAYYLRGFDLPAIVPG